MDVAASSSPRYPFPSPRPIEGQCAGSALVTIPKHTAHGITVASAAGFVSLHPEITVTRLLGISDQMRDNPADSGRDQRLFVNKFDAGADAGQLFRQAVVAALEVVDPMHGSGAIRREPGQH